MSRAIIFRFTESASLRIMAEEGLNNVILSEMRGDIGTPATKEIHGNLENFDMYEMQIDFASIPEIDKKIHGFPQIRYSKEGVMTFIEIFIPGSSGLGDLDVQNAAVSESIIEKNNSCPETASNPKEDIADIKNITYEIPELLEFSLEASFSDTVKALEAGDKDFSLQALEGAFEVFKSLPAHKDMMDFKDFMSELRKKEKEKVRVKAKVKSN